MTLALRGVIPPLVTPFDADGRLDRGSLERHVDRLVRAGVSGVFVGGTTGEIALLSDDDRTEAVRVAVGAAAGRVPVLAGAIDTGTARVVEHARRAAAAGADAVVVTVPFYVSPHPDEILRHVTDVAAAVDAPVVAYSIPSATHVPFPTAVLVELAARGTIVGFKDSSGDLGAFRTGVQQVAPSGVAMLTGADVLVDVALRIGAAGAVPGLANVDPAGYVALQAAADAGDWDAAAVHQRRLTDLFRIIDVADRRRVGVTAGSVGGFKTALHLLGVIDHPATAAPLGPLTADEVARVADLLRAAGLEPDA